jgi:Domain of Unknown Function (DUF928)
MSERQIKNFLGNTGILLVLSSTITSLPLSLAERASADSSQIYKHSAESRENANYQKLPPCRCYCPDERIHEAIQAITLIVPKNHSGKTISERPTLLIYLDRPIRVPIKTSLYNADIESQEPNNFYFQIEPPFERGIIAIDASYYAKSLEPGKYYRWVVGVESTTTRYCKSYTATIVEKINPSEELKMKVESAETSLKKSQTLAGSGIWYDAISLLYSSYSDLAPGRMPILSTWNQLLSEVGLTNISPIASPIKSKLTNLLENEKMNKN